MREGPTTVIAPAVCRDHSERMLLSCGVRLESEGLTHHDSSAGAAREPRISTCPGIFPPPHFSSWRVCWAAPGTACCCAMWDLNPTRTGLLDILRSMGGDIEIQNAPKQRRRTGGGFAGARLGAEGCRRCRRHACRSPSTNFRCCSSRPPAPEGRPSSRGAEELRVKESDRIAAMSAGFKTLGVEHCVTPDGMRIEGRAAGPAFGGGEVDSLRGSSDRDGLQRGQPACGQAA